MISRSDLRRIDCTGYELRLLLDRFCAFLSWSVVNDVLKELQFATELNIVSQVSWLQPVIEFRCTSRPRSWGRFIEMWSRLCTRVRTLLILYYPPTGKIYFASYAP